MSAAVGTHERTAPARRSGRRAMLGRRPGASGNREAGRGARSSPVALLGSSGQRALLLLAVLSAVKAVALILVAEALTRGIVAIVDGSEAWRGAVVLGTIGALLRGALVWATRVVAKRTTGASKAELRGALARRLMGARDPRVGAMTALGTKSLDELDAYFTTFLPALANALVVPLAIGAWILWNDWLSAVIIAVTIPLVPVFMILIGKHTQEEVARASDALLRLSDHLVELARGLPVLVGLGRVREQGRALARLSDEHRTRTMRTLRTAFMSSLALELISTISVAVVAVFIGLRLVYGSIDLTTGLVVLILAAECYTPFREAGSAYHAAEDGVNAMQRVRDVLDEPGQRPLFAADGIEADGIEADGIAADGVAAGGIAVRCLEVAFPGRAPLFRGFDCTIPSGSVVLLDGPSGAGKSTLIDVLAGRLGRVEGGGTGRDPGSATHSGASESSDASAAFTSPHASAPTDAEAPDRAAGQDAAPRVSGRVSGVDPARVAWTPQHPSTFATTLAGELVLHVAGADPAPAETERLTKRAGAVLAELGLNDAGRSPVTLSPGELRRLAVARALLRVDEGAELLLLDEPTAHLDADSAQRVRAAIRRRSGADDAVTVVIASHDPLVQRLCGIRIPVPSGGVGTGVATDEPDGTSDRTADRTQAAATAVGAADTRDIGHTGDTRDPGGIGRTGHTGGPEDPARDRRSGARELRRFLRPARWRFALAALLGALAVGFGISQTALSGWLIVSAAEQPPILLLTVAIVGVRFFGIGRSALRYAERLALHDAVFRGAGGLRGRLWDELASSGLRFSGMRRSDRTFSLFISDVDRVRDEVPRVVLPPVVAAATLTGFGIAAAFLLPSAVYPLLAVAAIGLVIAPTVALAADRSSAEHERATRQRLGAVFASALSAAPELHVHGVSGSVVARLDALEEEAGREARRTAWAEGLGHALAVAVSVGAACAIIATAAPAGGDGHADGKLVAVFALATLALAEPLLDAVTAVQRSRSLSSVLARVAGVRSRLTDGGGSDPAGSARPAVDARHAGGARLTGGDGNERAGANASTVPAANGEADPAAGLEIDAVTARWPGQPSPVFTEVSERVRPGEWLTVTGPSGSGKSTLLAVTLGHLPPERGTVRAAGLPVEPDVSGRIAWCPQDAHLFDSTLRANLLLARPADRRPSEREMLRALERVGLGPLLDGLEEGLDTRVGASGGYLSGGQRQRVAVARTLLTGAPVVLLDEPTAHLDAAGADELADDLRHALQGNAVVCVTHRATDVRPGDLRRELGGS